MCRNRIHAEKKSPETKFSAWRG